MGRPECTLLLALAASLPALGAAAQAPATAPPLPTRQAPLDPAGAAAGPRDPGAPLTPLSAPIPVFERRAGPTCTDFKPAEGASWSATANVEFPSPRGPIQIVSGQAVLPGDLSLGMDLGALLQRDCPRTVRPPA